jgi:hypothetical protein
MHIALPKARSGDKLPATEQRLGFLAANRDPELGYVGGLLLTTARGRPIEFHYTTPVNPSPTHKILYGPELEPYLLGELIGSNLIRQITVEPAFIVTDQPHVLNLRKNSPYPIVHVVNRPTAFEPPATKPGCGTELATHPEFADDSAALRRWLDEVNPGLNLNEPFARVWEAIREVMQAPSKAKAA